MKDIFKEFKPSSWSIDNRTSIYVLTIFVILAGVSAYNNLPKEKFPDIVIPTIYVSTIYPGTSPADIENLVTKPLEKQIKGISGIKKMTSNSLQDFSNVILEFNTTVDVALAKQKVKDAVDKARVDLPSDLPRDPSVMEIDFSEIPIIFVNLSGDYDLKKLKQYADDVKDRVESMKEITRVDIIGALDREIQVNLDMYKMQVADVTMYDVNNAIAMENATISGGTIKMDGMKRSLSVNGQFTNMEELRNITIRSMSGAVVKLKDIANVVDGFKEKESYARLGHKNVITLSVVKRSGENLINASDKVRAIVDDLQKNKFPAKLKVTLTGDQSDQTRTTLHDLINTIIIGFILVTILLMFFMGVTNAFFVAMSVPLSMFIAFLIMPTIGFSLNMIVLFAFLLALGIVVDDAIVVIENTHRIFNNGKVPIVKAAKKAAGEIFLPVLAGTLTTLAPFVPLAFWQGIIGKFMYFLPVTLIVTLLASLVVAYIINPVFAVSFMKTEEEEAAGSSPKKFRRNLIILAAVAGFFYLLRIWGVANFVVLMILLMVFYRFVLKNMIQKFQRKAWPAFQAGYERLISWALAGKRPGMLLIGTIVLFFLTLAFTAIRKPKVEFFPTGEPNFI